MNNHIYMTQMTAFNQLWNLKLLSKDETRFLSYCFFEWKLLGNGARVSYVLGVYTPSSQACPLLLKLVFPKWLSMRDPSLVPGNDIVKGENWFPEVCLWLCACTYIKEIKSNNNAKKVLSRKISFSFSFFESVSCCLSRPCYVKRMALNPWSYCFEPGNTRLTVLYHHAWT